MGNPAVLLDVNPEIPDKLYFRIGEVSEITGVKPHVLRYWETEFPALSPRKSGSNHRLYRRKDVETVLEIKRLLYGQRYTIEGARNRLAMEARTAKQARGTKAAAAQGELFGKSRPEPVVEQVRKELRALLEMLS